MHVFFEDDGQLKAGTVLADNDSSLQVEAASGKRLKVKAAAVLLRYAEPSPTVAARRGAEAGARARPEFPVGSLRRRGVRVRRSRARIFRPPARAERGGGGRAGARRRADVLLQARQGPLPQGAARCAEGRAGVGRAQEARGRADGGLGRRASRAPAARRAAREAADAPVQAGQERARVEGARGGVRRARRRARWRCSPSAARYPSSHDYHFNAFLAQAFPNGPAFPALAAPPAAARSPRGGGARVLDRRRDDDRDRRRVFGPRAAERPLRGRHPHRRAGARHRARVAARRDRPRAPVDRLHAGTQDHDAARRGRRRVHAGGGTIGAGAVAVCRGRAGRRARPARRRGSTAYRSPRTCASTRSAKPSPTTSRRRPIRRGRAELRVLWKLAQSLSGERGKADFARIDYSFYVDWKPDRQRARRAACASSRGRAAARSTSSFRN